MLAWNLVDIVRHPNTPVLPLWLVLWVLTRRKVAWTAKKRNPWFLPCWTTPPTKISTFLSSLQTFLSSLLYRHFVCAKFLSNVFGSSSMAVWMNVTSFRIYTIIVFFPWKQCHNDVTGACSLPQKMRCCLPDPMLPSLNSLAQSVQKLSKVCQPLIATVVAN